MTSKMPAPALSTATLLPNGFYALTLPPLMRKGKGKVFLADNDEPLSEHAHQLFFRPHDARVTNDLLPADRTVFVYNLPLDATAAQLKTLFQPAGKVESVIIGHVGPATTKEEIDARMSTLADPTTAAPHRPAEVAYVIYKKVTALPQLPKIVNAKNWAVKAAMPMGLARYKAQFDATHATNHAALEERAKEVIAEYDARKAEEDRAMRTKTVDEDGFILVTRKRGARVEAAQNVKPKEHELKDFYRFQMREEKRSRLLELREKFAQDKKKIEELKQSRRFKPY
ncbi:hypothetical protein AMAG_00054 [Allomyces macrogynus ATCC 38327]|uniref:RRM domain-containing protein n=1 Tax=Allomyces macrogynus (strain ATCC 38327) TaxID=578462 RepID=A0A0L0RVF6_ALLM3|nr:hypothetical protein AMAG_00054 [Allomyces macrogynus ATCC 38327]|eukprot:KNE54051.1 hypothetical protein AMAG_00054 [Allomyces macrogynus ATCC 38327]